MRILLPLNLGQAARVDLGAFSQDSVPPQEPEVRRGGPWALHPLQGGAGSDLWDS